MVTLKKIEWKPVFGSATRAAGFFGPFYVEIYRSVLKIAEVAVRPDLGGDVLATFWLRASTMSQAIEQFEEKAEMYVNSIIDPASLPQTRYIVLDAIGTEHVAEDRDHARRLATQFYAEAKKK